MSIEERLRLAESKIVQQEQKISDLSAAIALNTQAINALSNALKAMQR